MTFYSFDVKLISLRKLSKSIHFAKDKETIFIMEEKEIIRSELDKRLFVYCGILVAVGTIITFGIFCDGGPEAWIDYAFGWGLLSIEAFLSWGGLILLVGGIVLFCACRHCEIIVTERRVYGVARFNSRVDIPLDSITSIGMRGLDKCISVASSSGLIKFIYIKNNSEIHKVVSELILGEKVINDKVGVSEADELKKYKGLFDQGIISQEEFDAKKKQLLDL